MSNKQKKNFEQTKEIKTDLWNDALASSAERIAYSDVRSFFTSWLWWNSIVVHPFRPIPSSVPTEPSARRTSRPRKGLRTNPCCRAFLSRNGALRGPHLRTAVPRCGEDGAHGGARARARWRSVSDGTCSEGGGADISKHRA